MSPFHPVPSTLNPRPLSPFHFLRDQSFNIFRIEFDFDGEPFRAPNASASPVCAKLHHILIFSIALLLLIALAIAICMRILGSL